MILVSIHALDNGYAVSPPMGWRSWNCFALNVNQSLMEDTIRAMAKKRKGVVSLLDLGYETVGLDDGWQKCGAGVFGGFHDSRGYPIVDKEKFPDMRGMTDLAHSLGIRVGWYHNNCYCKELSCKYQAPPCWQGEANISKHYEGDVKALIDFNFDGVKLDGCGQFRNLTRWADMLNATGRKMVIENCHGPPFPTWPNDTTTPSFLDGPCVGDSPISECPYSLYRTSSDITSNFESVYSNLLSTRRFASLTTPPLSRPGSWGYPDMLEVARLSTFDQDQTHFGAWAIVSSPLTLGFDVTNDTLLNRVWPIISNEEVIAINQAFVQHPGTLVKTFTVGDVQVDLWAKPIKKGAIAAFIFSADPRGVDQPFSFHLSDLPASWLGAFNNVSSFDVRDVFLRKDRGRIDRDAAISVIGILKAPMSSEMLVLKPVD